MKTFQQAASLVALTALGAGMLAISVTAQARGNDHQRLDWLTEQLELSSEQASTIGLLMEAHREQMQSIDRRGENGRPGEQARDQARAARQALHEEIDAVLTEEQRSEFAGLMEARRQHGRRAGRMGYSMGYFMAALDSLDVSDDQRQAIQTLVQDQRAQGRIQREAFRAELESILTEEQLAELDAMRDQRSSRRHRGRHNG